MLKIFSWNLFENSVTNSGNIERLVVMDFRATTTTTRLKKLFNLLYDKFIGRSHRKYYSLFYLIFQRKEKKATPSYYCN